MSLKLTRFTRCLLPRGNNKTSSKEDSETRVGTVWEKQKPAEKGFGSTQTLRKETLQPVELTQAMLFLTFVSCHWAGLGWALAMKHFCS